MNQKEGYKSVVSFNLPIKTLEKIDELMHRHRIENRSKTIGQLITVGLFCESKMGLVETWTSKDIDDIKAQMESGQLVDWIHTMDHKKFTTLMHVFEDEGMARGLVQKKLD